MHDEEQLTDSIVEAVKKYFEENAVPIYDTNNTGKELDELRLSPVIQGKMEDQLRSVIVSCIEDWGNRISDDLK